MKRIKKITAFISAILLAANGCHTYVIADIVNSTENNSEYESEQQSKPEEKVVLELSPTHMYVLEKLRIKTKDYDGTRDAEIDLSDIGIAGIEDIPLEGKKEEDDVYLTAVAQFDTSDAGNNKKVCIQFELNGEDKDKYVLSEDISTKIVSGAIIEMKNVQLEPTGKMYIYKGEEIPNQISYTFSDSEKYPDFYALIKPECNNSQVTGSYALKLENNNPNYLVSFSPKYKFDIIDRAKICFKEFTYDGEDNTVISGYKVEVTAPENCYVGTDISKVDKKNITCDVKYNESASGETITYYLKTKDNDLVHTITQNVNRESFSVDKDSVKISTADGSDLKKVVLSEENILTTNKNVKINVDIYGDELKQNINAELMSGDSSYKAKSISSELINGIWCYKAEFEITDVESDKSKEYNFELSVTDAFGNPLNEKLVFGDSNIDKVIIDKDKPFTNEGDIVIFYNNNTFDVDEFNKNSGGYFIAIGNVKDNGSGIAKIEYKWDDDVYATAYREYGVSGGINKYHDGNRSYNYFEAKGCNKYYNGGNEFSEYKPGKETDFQILVPYCESVYPKDHYHKLYLRITDNAGNVNEIEGKKYLSEKSGGMDTLPPELVDLKIVSKEYHDILNDDQIDDVEKESKLKELKDKVFFRTFKSGNYAAAPIVFEVKAIDKSESKNFILGLQSVSLKDKDSVIMKVKNEDEGGEYIYFSLSDNKLIEELKICITDGCKEQEILLNKVKNKLEGKFSDIESNTLIIENSAPETSYIIQDENDKVLYDSKNDSDQTHTSLWLNSGKSIVITGKDISPKSAVPISGIHSIHLKESDKFKAVVDTSDQTERFESQDYKIVITDKFESGEYTYYAYSEDNCGNTSEETEIKFNVDVVAPYCTIISESPKFGDSWYSDNDDFTLMITLGDKHSGIDLDSVKVKVNGTEIVIDKENIETDDLNNYIIKLKKSDFKDFDNNIIKTDARSCYCIEVLANDIAGNKLSENNTCEVHIDKFAPWIEKLEVSELDESESKILNIFNFGIFSNNSVNLNIFAYDNDRDKTEDNEYESQIQSVKINYGDMEEELKKDENGSYKIPVLLPPDINEVFKKTFTITVTDNVGRTCSRNYRIIRKSGDDIIVGAEDSDSNEITIVLETKPPVIELRLPEVPYTEKSDDAEKYWFSGETKGVIQLDVRDKDSGINSVVVKENGKDIKTDDTEELSQEMISSDKVNDIDTQAHTYVFRTDKSHLKSESSDEYLDISGKHEWTFWATDNSGNESPQQKYVYYIDNTMPEITEFQYRLAVSPDTAELETESKPAVKLGIEGFKIDDLNYGMYFNEDLKLKIFAKDISDSSGLKAISYKLISYDDINNPVDTEVGSKEIIHDHTGSYIEIDIEKGFKGIIIAHAVDNVMNVSEEKLLTPSVIVEDVPPEVEISYSSETVRKDNAGNDLYAEDMSVTVMITDKKSGIKNWKVSQTSEKNTQLILSEGKVQSDTSDKKWNIGDITEDGWKIEQTEANLVTVISKTFYFDSDDNDIMLEIDVNDNCDNKKTEVTKKFTVDKTAPVIDIQCSEGYNGTLYYNQSKPASINIAVTERNFDEELIRTIIENSYNGNIPQISFDSDPADNSRHTAVVTFPEGDYTFDIEGSDRAGFEAVVNKPYDGRRRFYVDETSPVVKTNFDTFGQAGEDIYFNSSKKAVISVREHNFDFENIGLKVYRKDAGSAHNSDYFTDTTYSFVGYADWVQDSADRDLYTVEFETDMDAVYKIEIYPYDKAGNAPVFDSSRSDTEVYEIDTTMPEVKMKNGEFVSGKENEFEFLDIYSENSGDIVSPTVEFDDINYDYLEYTLVKFTPEYSNGKELDSIEAKSVTQKINEKKFTLTDFETDGIYAVEIIAFDKAGNKSVVNKNTYIRMKDNEVLAYIPDSNKKNKTGLYSFEYEDGKPISKRPDDFSDVEIFIISKNGNTPKIVLRDMNGDEKDTNLEPDVQNTDLYGATVYSYTLRSDFFIDNYQSDTDKELILTVKENENRIDLGNIHIDNIAPDAEVPEEFKSWHWYPGTEPREIVVTDINEILDYAQCKVYDNNEEIVFDYSEEEKTLRFTLSEGWHNVGIHLVDTAGNVYDVQEADNIYVGNMWSWIMAGSALLVGAGATVIVLKRKKR
ncbi:MAG: hypothetical protein E7510_13275 [Ruminococcus sp.]|nr:hypothetical protein [Ruminococcus sp.]